MIYVGSIPIVMCMYIHAVYTARMLHRPARLSRSQRRVFDARYCGNCLILLSFIHFISRLLTTLALPSMAAESKADGKARVQDVVEEIHDDAEEGSSGSEEDAAPETKASSSTPSAQASTTKKKKKKKKVAKALQSLLKGKDKEVPQALVDEVLHRVQEEQGPNAEGADEQSVRKALEAMKIVDMLQGKSGVGGKNKKDAGDHKVCACDPGSAIDFPTELALVLVNATSSPDRYARIAYDKTPFLTLLFRRRSAGGGWANRAVETS
jgi:hypothetical protein